MKLIITRGLPGSGKTTLARAWVAKDPQRRVRVNRDDLRRMAHDSVYVPESPDAPGTERAITMMRNASVRLLLSRGLDVVVDDTNLPVRTARDLRRIAVLAGAEFEVWDLTDVSVDVCLLRNRLRSDKACVPEPVIHDMYQRYVKGKGHPLPLPDEVADGSEMTPYVPLEHLPRAVIADLDGTMCLMGVRSPYDETRVHEDRPNQRVIDAIVAVVQGTGSSLVITSGRTEACREATEEWLAKHVPVPYAELHMRPVGDMRKDAGVKYEIFDTRIRNRWNVQCVFDDRNQVVDMWRAIGLTCLQVAPGDF